MVNGSPSLYHDFSGLAALKHQAREDQSGATEKVAKQFESLFVQMMVKQMRQASFGGGIFDSDRTRFYQDMYDQQLSLHLSEQGGMGIGGVLRRQIGGSDEVMDKTLSGLDPYWRHPVVQMGIKPQDSTAVQTTERVANPSISEPEEVVSLDSPENFVQGLWSAAEHAAAELGLPPEALLAQAALETGWGSAVMQSGNGQSSHNLFGIKADQRWDGGQVKKETLEYEDGVAVRKRERFRTYASFEQSFQDYVAFLKATPRYAEALTNAEDPSTYFRSLQDAGYATDPAYADKIMRVMQGPEMQTALASFKASS
ncbi:MAG: flagellar assembly peptidoglycan hydrolase FlgJ [Candidatus Thiodiazotropha sp. (ex Myrtea sp. 'scaly one' KF741663)]|nr:flagellar assembly peptidoglycan hydrolase FlgJ [Candidatus Thiodiazotropha sp. (ex Myrtea sp. 'scaly one' KF741663)]